MISLGFYSLIRNNKVNSHITSTNGNFREISFLNVNILALFQFLSLLLFGFSVVSQQIKTKLKGNVENYFYFYFPILLEFFSSMENMMSFHIFLFFE